MKEFAYQFLFVAEGLNISDAELKDIFNTSLNEHVPAWEMGMLGILSFWQFVGYVYHRGEEGASSHSMHRLPSAQPSNDPQPENEEEWACCSAPGGGRRRCSCPPSGSRQRYSCPPRGGPKTLQRPRGGQRRRSASSGGRKGCSSPSGG